jgi:basic membrane lipoprotein Med (substrate-binding protein (PBP1-ABC) superfamily)
MKNRLKILCVLSAFTLLFCAILASPAVTVAKELTVVAIMYGHANEGTWDPSAYQGLLKAQEKTPFTLHLHEGTTTQDAEKVIRNWAAKGMDVVFAHSDIYIDQVISVAKRFKKVHFICETQIDPALLKDDPEQAKYAPENAPPNLVLSGDTPWEGNYMAGYVAAMVSKTGMLGVLQPFEAPPLNRYTNCFLFGAQAAKPDIKVKVVYIGDYIAPAETRDGVKSLAESGCDVIFSQMDDNSAILESAAQGVYCIPMYMDKSDVDPKTVLTSVVMDWSGPLGGAIEAVAKDNWDEYRKQWYFRPLSAKDGSIFLGKWGTTAPDDVKKAAADLNEKFKNGELTVKLVDEVLIK